MAEIIIKSSVAIAISYLLYFCFLRNNTRFRWIRIYFLVSVAASLFIPMLSELFRQKQELWVQIPAVYLSNFITTNEVTNNAGVVASDSSRAFSFSQWLPWLYFTGVTVVLLRFFIGLIHLLFLTIKFGIQKVGTDRLVILQTLPYPFSFLHLIFINRQTLSEGNHGAMLQHERAHVKQWHSLDLMMLELLVAFQWFNPFAWLFRRSVKELHEYLADEEVLRHQPSTLDYQLLLFNQVCGTSIFQPVNGFISSLTKKRILMITNNNKTKRWFTAFISLIVVIVAIQSLSLVNVAQDPPKTNKNESSSTASKSSGTDINTAYLVKPSTVNKDAFFPLPLFHETSTFQETLAKMGAFITSNNNLPSSFTTSKTKKGTFVKVMFSDNGKVQSVDIGAQSQKMVEQLKPIEIDESAPVISEIERILKSAPDFMLQKSTEGELCNGAIYCITFENSKCNVIPCKWFLK